MDKQKADALIIDEATIGEHIVMKIIKKIMQRMCYE